MKGANADVQDINGKTPVDHAKTLKIVEGSNLPEKITEIL